MSVKFDKTTLNKINDKEFNIDEAVLLLNKSIDDELSKEEPDFDYIKECTDSIIELENCVYHEPDLKANPIKSFKALDDNRKIKVSKAIMRTLLIAAIIFATTITANATYTNVTGNTIMDAIVSTVEKNKKADKKNKKKKPKANSSTTSRRYYSYRNTTTSVKKSEPTTQPEPTTDSEEEYTSEPITTEAVSDDYINDENVSLPNNENNEVDVTEPVSSNNDTTQIDNMNTGENENSD